MDIFSLLPYNKEHLLRKRSEKIALLKLLHALCLEMQESIIKFKQNDMQAFDAQVGDTLCQIRAHKLLCLDEVEGLDGFLELLEIYTSRLSLVINNLNIKSQFTPKFDRELD